MKKKESKILLFDEEYQKIKSELKLQSDFEKRYYKLQFPRYRTLFSIFEKEYNYEQRILDIGVHPGYFTYILCKMGYKVEGVDLYPENINEIIRKKIEIKKRNIEKEKLPYNNNTFNGVMLNAVLEHLKSNPIMGVKEIHRVLKRNGKLIVQTPNLSWWRARVSILLGKSFDESPYSAFKLIDEIGYPGHVRVYTMKETIEMLSKCGLKIVDNFWINNGELVKYNKARIFNSFKKQIIVIASKS